MTFWRRLRSNPAALRNKLRVLAPDVPVLGTLPRLPAAQIDAALGGVIQAEPFATGMAGVTQGLLQRPSSPHKTVLVTSAAAGEGKSTLALNLAVGLAQRSRVLLIDADLRNPALSRRLNLPRYDAGLSELVSCDAPYRSCLALTGMANLHAIRSGSLPADPAALLRAPRLAMTLQLSARYYEHIVIDSPALAVYPDAVILAQLVDTVVIVIDARQRRFDRIRNAVKLLKQVNAPVAGFVLNGVSG